MSHPPGMALGSPLKWHPRRHRPSQPISARTHASAPGKIHFWPVNHSVFAKGELSSPGDILARLCHLIGGGESRIQTRNRTRGQNGAPSGNNLTPDGAPVGFSWVTTRWLLPYIDLGARPGPETISTALGPPVGISRWRLVALAVALRPLALGVVGCGGRCSLWVVDGAQNLAHSLWNRLHLAQRVTLGGVQASSGGVQASVP